jgi:uncharacterized RDD family membrane protein YckC
VARRLASAVYEALLLFALALVATFPFWFVFGEATHGWRLYALRAWLLAVLGTYLVFSWTRSGQTLPMKVWRIALVRAADGGPVRLFQALHRFLLAVLSTLALGLGFLWAFVDRDRQFLHDRLAGTALVDRR